MSKVINIQEIGDVVFVKSKSAKRISIVLKPFKNVKVTFPYWSSYNRAVQVVNNKKAWILSSKQKMQLIENRATIFDENSNYITRKHKLVIEQTETDKIIVRVSENKILVKYPNCYNVTDNCIQLYIKKGIELALHKEAAEYLPQRVDYLAKLYKFKYTKLGLRKSRTRWGSCSGNNNINLSVHLMRLPSHLIDFVILHELLHTKIKNHSKEFWDALDKITGNVKALRKEMKNYNISVF